ncbi:hypothetical protein F5884DRAFT_758395 [Xylogone sp. PMI_703]|nr:hypothetical protein F5884DRAFT_758395 [Xylogone sp. PMI_703]
MGSHTMLVHKLFEERARESPNSPAIQFENEDPLSISSLNRMAEQIAVALPAERNSCVAIYLPRSTVMVGYMLAVQKREAAYIVLDPDHPLERTLSIVQEVGVKFILHNRSFMLPDLLTPTKIYSKLYLSELQTSGDSVCLPPLDNDADLPAHIIYTSGSTGRPKGVLCTHSSICAGLRTTILDTSVSQWTIWTCLILGPYLCLASKDRLLTALDDVINGMSIDTLSINPTASFLIHPNKVPGLKKVFLTGERTSDSVIERWAGKIKLQNKYGMSKCPVVDFSCLLSPGSDPRCIGKPVGMTTLILSEDQTVPTEKGGVDGEVRALRTGDLTRHNDDGTISIIGRADNQVNISGQRVEPEEVAFHLKRVPSVANCTVFGATMNSSMALVAYIVLSKDIAQSSTFSDLVQYMHQYLSKRIPLHMVPNYWRRVDELPLLNARGKMDLLRMHTQAEELGPSGLISELHQPHETASQSGSGNRAILYRIVAQILGLPLNFVDDKESFLNLGGTSLLALQVIYKLRKEGLTIEPGDLLLAPSLVNISIKPAKENPTAKEPPVQISPFSLIANQHIQQQVSAKEGVLDAYPLTPAQRYMIDGTLKGELGYLSQEVWSLENVDISKLKMAFQTVFSNNNILRSSVILEGESLIQVIFGDMELPWEDQEEELETFLAQDYNKQVRFKKPLIRITNVKNQYLAVTMHHLIFDF